MESDALKPKTCGEEQNEEGRVTLVPFCDSAASWEWEEEESTDGGVGEVGGKWASSEKQNSVSAQRNEEEEGKGAGGREGCWCFADALGVVEILQQRASPLLGNVHLVLQILSHPKQKINDEKLDTKNKDEHFYDAGWSGFIYQG